VRCIERNFEPHFALSTYSALGHVEEFALTGFAGERFTTRSSAHPRQARTTFSAAADEELEAFRQAPQSGSPDAPLALDGCVNCGPN